MSRRLTIPRVVTCDHCGGSTTIKFDGGGAFHFCGNRCKVAFWHDRGREATWLLLELVRALWPHRPADFVFVPRDYPTLDLYRVEFNRAADWLRELKDNA